MLTFLNSALIFLTDVADTANQQAELTPAQQFISAATTILPIVLVAVAFYFFLIRPQKKQEKEFNNMLNSLQPGDEITTKGGIIGKVVSIKEETMVIETSKDRTKIRLLRSAVAKIDVKAEDAE